MAMTMATSSPASNSGHGGGGSSSGKSKRASQREGNLADKYQATGKCTTVMIRNIPLEYTQDEFIREVSEVMGSSHLFDFFYLPPNMQNDCNMGYAFVNFLDPSVAQHAVRTFSNYQFVIHESKKSAKVSPAHIQGLENNLRHLQDRAVVLGNHPCSPVVMWKGQKVELSLIFQELKTQDTLQKFENGENHASSPGRLRVDVPQIYNDCASPPSSSPGLMMVGNEAVVGVGEGFARLLDRAAGLNSEMIVLDHAQLELRQRAAMAGCGRPVMQGQGRVVPPGLGCFPAGNSNLPMVAPGRAGMCGISPVTLPLETGRCSGPPPGHFGLPRHIDACGAQLPMASTLNAAAPPWPPPGTAHFHDCGGSGMGCGMLAGPDAECMYLAEDLSPGYHAVQDPRFMAGQAGDFLSSQHAVQHARHMAAQAGDFGGPAQNAVQDPRLMAARAEDFSPGQPAAPDPRLRQSAAEQAILMGGAPGLPMPGSFSASATASYADDGVARLSPSSAATASIPPAPPLVPPGNLQLPAQQLPEDIAAPPVSPPSMAVSSSTSNPVIKEITLQDANDDLMDKFMKKFDF